MSKKSGYQRLIEAFTIFSKYSNEEDVLCAEHDAIWTLHNKQDISVEDKEALNELGWHWDSDENAWCLFT